MTRPPRSGRRQPAVRVRFAVLAALSVVTFLFLGTDLRFRSVAGDLTANLDFAEGLRGWGGGTGGVWLTETEGRRTLVLDRRPGGPVPFVFRDLTAPQRFSHLRFAAELRTEGVVRGDKRLQRAGAVLWSFDPSGKRLRHWPGALALLSEDGDWRRYSRVLPVHEAAAIMRVYLFVGGRSGRLWARDIVLEPVAEIPGAATARAGLLVLWVLVGLWAAAPMLVQAARRPGVLLILVVGAGIAAGTLTPQPHLSQILGSVASDLRAVLFPVDDDPPVPDGAQPATGRANEAGDRAAARSETEDEPAAPDAQTRDGTAADAAPAARPARSARPGGTAAAWPRLDSTDRAHLLAFALLGFLVGWVYRAPAPATAFAFALLVAVIGEVLQYFTPSRDSEASDLLFNLLGTGAGLALAALAGRRRRRPT